MTGLALGHRQQHGHAAGQDTATWTTGEAGQPMRETAHTAGLRCICHPTDRTGVVPGSYRPGIEAITCHLRERLMPDYAMRFRRPVTPPDTFAGNHSHRIAHGICGSFAAIPPPSRGATAGERDYGHTIKLTKGGRR